VEQVELENENGCLVYDVKFVEGWEIKVDAGNGKVLAPATLPICHVPVRLW
jgi:uncharacterized membrane protein YkoI